MNFMSSGTLNSLDQFNTEQKQQLYQSSQVNLAAFSREQSIDISIETKEGDKVTLSADSSFDAAYATYNSQARVNGSYSESRGRLSSVHFEREITLRVQGDLNEEEKKEIKKVLQKIFKMMKNFLAGQHGKLAESDVKDIKLDTLADVEARVEVTQSTLEVKHASAESVTKSTVPAGESDGDARAMDRLISRMAKAVRDAKVEHEKFMKHFEHNPSGMSDEYLKQEPDGRKMSKMLRDITSGLFRRLDKMAG